EQLIRDPLIHTYLNLVDELEGRVSPHVIATTLMMHLKGLKSEGLDVSAVGEDVLKTLLSKVGEGSVSRDAIPEILREYASHLGKVGMDELIAKYAGMTEEDVDRVVRETVERLKETLLTKKEKAFSIVMGEVMKVIRGRADGKMVADLVRRRLSELDSPP
ncbi:MAG: hypothetical protein QXM76_03515, partial [Zestosphaera sp.]